MDLSVQNNSSEIYQTQNKKKNTGKVVGALGGVTLGAAYAMNTVDCFLRPSSIRNEALDKLRMLEDYQFLNKSARKNFLYNAQKTLKKNYIVNAGLAAVAFITGGLALGTIVDAITNSVRNKKAAKTS